MTATHVIVPYLLKKNIQYPHILKTMNKRHIYIYTYTCMYNVKLLILLQREQICTTCSNLCIIYILSSIKLLIISTLK